MQEISDRLISACKYSLWPWYYIYIIIFTSSDDDIWKMEPMYHTYEYDWTPYYLVAWTSGTVIHIIIAYLSYLITFNGANISSIELSWSLIICIICRDLFITFVFFGLWHWLFYGNHKYKEKLSKRSTTHK